MELKELKIKSDSELEIILSETREKLRELRFKDASHQLKNVREIRKIRTEIAQALTIINSRKADLKKAIKKQ
jgi:ribosomal protein L29